MALDLSTKSDEDSSSPEPHISSPQLMPLPKVLPKSKIANIALQPSAQKFKPTLVKTQVSNKLACSPIADNSKDTKYNTGDCYLNSKDLLTNTKPVNCSVPTTDVKCYINNNVQLHSTTRKMMRQQDAKKIYTTPDNVLKNTQQTEKKNAEKLVMKVLEKLTGRHVPFKFNTQHFRQKNLEIDEVDVNFIERPMCSSTPTPGHDSTILAGHLNYSIEEEEETMHENLQNNDYTENDKTLKEILALVKITEPRKKENNPSRNLQKFLYLRRSVSAMIGCQRKVGYQMKTQIYCLLCITLLLIYWKVYWTHFTEKPPPPTKSK